MSVTLDTSKVFDASPEELDRVKRRAEIRQRLKAEFNRQFYNPYRQVYHVELLDPAIQRFMAARASRYDYWNPTWKGFFAYFGLHLLPMAAMIYYTAWDTDRKEKGYRAQATGFTYADRTYKHIYVPQCPPFVMMC